MGCHAHAVSIGMMQEFLICVILGTALTEEEVGSLEKSLKKKVFIFARDIPLR
jgi:3-dehydroquinate synthetase